MIQGGDGACFTLEAIAESLGRNLDRDFTMQPRIGGAINFAHATRADGRKDLVRAKAIAHRQRHIAAKLASPQCCMVSNVPGWVVKPLYSAVIG